MVGHTRRNPAARKSSHTYFSEEPEHLTRGKLHDAHVHLQMMPKKQVVAEYIARDLDRAVTLLHLLEADVSFGVKAFFHNYATAIVRDLRLYLEGKGRLRHRPASWVDPWKLDYLREVRRANLIREIKCLNSSIQRRFDRAKAHIDSVTRMAGLPTTPLALPPHLLMPIPEWPMSFQVPPFVEGRSRQARRRRTAAAFYRWQQAAAAGNLSRKTYPRG